MPTIRSARHRRCRYPSVMVMRSPTSAPRSWASSAPTSTSPGSSRRLPGDQLCHADRQCGHSGRDHAEYGDRVAPSPRNAIAGPDAIGEVAARLRHRLKCRHHLLPVVDRGGFLRGAVCTTAMLASPPSICTRAVVVRPAATICACAPSVRRMVFDANWRPAPK